jgi:hypothetical protein
MRKAFAQIPARNAEAVHTFPVRDIKILLAIFRTLAPNYAASG